MSKIKANQNQNSTTLHANQFNKSLILFSMHVLNIHCTQGTNKCLKVEKAH